MKARTKNDQEIEFKKLDNSEFNELSNYLNGLSEETKKRFGPHRYDNEAVRSFYEDSTNTGYIALDKDEKIIAYSILRLGFLVHDQARLESYGLTLSQETDCTFAPSVADAWQSIGIGHSMLKYILENLTGRQAKRIILWGGVQCSNTKAINFYKSRGFRELGQFEYYGMNLDMIRDVI